MQKKIATRRGQILEVCCFGNRKVLRLDLYKSRKGFCREGRGRSLHEEGPNTKKAREETVECLVQGIWRKREQKQSEEYANGFFAHRKDVCVVVSSYLCRSVGYYSGQPVH